MHSKARLFLTPTERNLLNYVISQTNRHPERPCLVPPHINTAKQDYLRAIRYLEERGFLEVNRVTPHYPTWVVAIKALPEQCVRKKVFK